MLQAVLLASSLSGDLGRDVTLIAGAVPALLRLPLLLVVVVVAAMVAPSSVGQEPGSEPPSVPAEQLQVTLEVGARSGVPWELLAAIALVERGPGADSDKYRAAIARDLIAAGVESDVPQAVYAHSHSWQYAPLVLARAWFYSASRLEPQPPSTAPLEAAP